MPGSGLNWPAQRPALPSSATGSTGGSVRRPWGILGGVVLGLVGGLYHLVRESLEAVREAGEEDREEARRDGTGD